MPITIHCPFCKAAMSAPAAAAGRVVACPKCHNPLTVPGAGPATAPAPETPAESPFKPDSPDDAPVISGYSQKAASRYRTQQLPTIVIVAAWVVVCLGGPLMLHEIGRRILAEITYLIERSNQKQERQRALEGYPTNR